MSTISSIGFLLVFLLPIGLTAVLVSFIIFFIRRWRENAYVPFFSYALSNWITLVILVLFVFPKIGLNPTNIGFKSAVSLREISLALLFTFVGFGWFALMGRIKIFEIKGMDFKIASWKHIAVISFYAPITAAFCEEFFYRGFVITVLGRELGNFWMAGIISCFAFAFIHIPYFGLGGFVQVGIWGFLPMILFIVTGSVYPGTIMHSLNNFYAYILHPLFFRK